MKRGKPMKFMTFLALATTASLALAQAPAKEPAKPEAAKEGMKPVAVKQAAKKPNPKRQEDARHCLEQPNATAIIKCAEEYL